MEVVVPWQALIELIELHYPKTSKKGGNPPYPLATMLRIHLLQHWYSLSDPAMEEALIEVPTMRRFAGIELISDRTRAVDGGGNPCDRVDCISPVSCCTPARESRCCGCAA